MGREIHVCMEFICLQPRNVVSTLQESIFVRFEFVLLMCCARFSFPIFFRSVTGYNNSGLIENYFRLFCMSEYNFIVISFLTMNVNQFFAMICGVRSFCCCCCLACYLLVTFQANWINSTSKGIVAVDYNKQCVRK